MTRIVALSMLMTISMALAADAQPETLPTRAATRKPGKRATPAPAQEIAIGEADLTASADARRQELREEIRSRADKLIDLSEQTSGTDYVREFRDFMALRDSANRWKESEEILSGLPMPPEPSRQAMTKFYEEEEAARIKNLRSAEAEERRRQEEERSRAQIQKARQSGSAARENLRKINENVIFRPNDGTRQATPRSR